MSQSQSILSSTKKALGLAEDYDAFDTELVMHINSALGTLNQLGVGPDEGFEIEDADAKWSEFLTDKRLSSARSFVFLSVKQDFDPPQNSFAVTAIKDKIQELSWRLEVARVPVPNDPVDGGGV